MNTVPVFFTDAMVASSGCFSPSAEKPAKVALAWQALALPLRFVEPVRASLAELCRSHDEAYVRGVLAGKVANGFGNRSAEVARSLPWTSGAMLSAARHALEHQGAAVAPCSGFHHAGWAEAEGYCTFNGLTVTALALHAEGARRIGILDCDHHWGNGTEAILNHLGQPDWVHHVTIGKRYSRPKQAREFFEKLPALLGEFEGCDVMLYQAGADPHIDDPLGGWLTTEQLRVRDAMVFEGLAAMKVPVAWNLAGGYQRDAAGNIPRVLEVHENTLRECLRVFL